MQALNYLAKKFNLNLNQRYLPIEIPSVRRDDLVDWIREFNFKVGVEIGTERGFFAETICEFNPQIKLYVVDPWEAYKGYRDYTDKDKLVNEIYKYAKRRLEPIKNCEIIKDFSMEAIKRFKDNSLDFVYIDGNHELPFVLHDILYWARKVKKGGIISGHDYTKLKRFHSKNHTVYAVNMYVQAYRIRPWFLLGEKHGDKNDVRDKSLSWMWVKTHDYC